MSNDTITIPATLPKKVADLLAMRGTIATLQTVRTMKVRKGQAEVLKESTFQCRLGSQYENLSAVKEKRENGDLPAEPQPMSWGEWVEGCYPHLKIHKGNYYLRCSVVHNNFIPKTIFYQNGKEISKEQAQAACLASEFYEKDNECFDIKIESLISVNGQVFI
jgi:hypothetical protein